MFGKNKREKLFKELENAGALPAYKINAICGKVYAIAQKGDGEAYYKLYLFAKDNYKNHGVEAKYRDWLGLLEKAAALEYPEAVCEHYGRHAWGDPATRIAKLEKVALNGYDRACIILSQIYDRAYNDHAEEDVGKLTKEECAQNVIKWLTPAAERGNTEAQLRLGNFLSLYRNDLDGGMKWFSLAEEKGGEEAYIGLARIYRKKDDLYRAQRYYKLAADKGNAIALCGLGEICLLPGTYQNIEKGLKLLEESSDKGNMFAALRLSEIYEKGEVVPQDSEKSEFWKNRFEQQRKAFFKTSASAQTQAENNLTEK